MASPLPSPTGQPRITMHLLSLLAASFTFFLAASASVTEFRVKVGEVLER